MDDTIPLRRSVLHAVGWATATRFLAQMVNWAMTLATIRFLSPQDYGLMAVAMTIVSFIGQIGSVGICDAVVQKQDV
ncbi:MAG: oligosaccharide flippase family protein, partial [Stellaceae bacterium]